MFIRRWLIGIPLATVRASGERLSKVVALAVFSSDALSSVAYATEEMLLVLVLAGSLALDWSLPLSLAITLLLGILTVSYRQTIHAYPSGGGSYIVAKTNRGELPGLTALSHLYGLLPREGETLFSQLAWQVFGGDPLYYLVQAATMLILILASNTSFAGFPRPASFLARDRYVPTQLFALPVPMLWCKGAPCRRRWGFRPVSRQ